MITLLKKLKNKIALNIGFFFLKNIGGRVKKYKYLSYNAGWLFGVIKNSYLSIHLRPKRSKDFNFNQFQCRENDSSNVGIILQGPISVNGDNGEFVYETIKIYKKIFPNVMIVLSTWEVNENNLQKFNKLKIKIIQNKEPKNNRFGTVRNIDRQIFSTFSALKYLSEKKINYSFKTRTDWRIYKPNIHHYLKNMIDIFPSKSKFMNGRIIVSSMMTSKFRVYGIADTLQFGFTDDLLKFWDDELFLDGIERLSFGSYPTVINHTPVISEVFLCARYLKKINHTLNWTLEDWWTCLSKYFCVIDSDSLDLLWTKYEDWFYEKRYYRSYDSNSARMLEFSEWINLYSDSENTILNWKDLGYQEKWKIDDGKLKFEKFY